MESDVIFMRSGGGLVPLASSAYEAEDVLQRLLERHPQLLAGYQMSREDPRRFLLVRREALVPDQEGAAGRWSVDHLFLDQDAIPTLVEVKRSSDSRIRREVVGQLLDYAANGARYWADGALRLVFVADVIPEELQAVIEFLNARMHDTEVFGVEVRRYGGAADGECFVPRLVGATAAAAADRKQRTSLDEKLQTAAPPEVSDAAERLRFLAAELGLAVREVRANLRVCDQIGPVVLLYPTYQTLEFPLYALLDAGRETEVIWVRDALRRIAGDSRKMAAKAPNIGCSEALARWDELADIVRVVMRARSEIAARPSA